MGVLAAEGVNAPLHPPLSLRALSSGAFPHEVAGALSSRSHSVSVVQCQIQALVVWPGRTTDVPIVGMF